MKINLITIFAAILLGFFIGTGELKALFPLMFFILSIATLVGLFLIKYIFDIKSPNLKKAIVFFRVCALAMFVLLLTLIYLTSKKEDEIEEQSKAQVYSVINNIPANAYSKGCPDELKKNLAPTLLEKGLELQSKDGGCLISLYRHLGGFSVMGQDFFVQNVNGKLQIKYSVWKD
jgi:hypothetical protein